ncbi:unnamed protein product [Arabidopsis thaliana]|uniref:ELMO domain-containing protein n=1 Tax=Arabidopsis thaliana TaxID=3702 RepID=A0A654FCC3_ARATH|nr:unnamed protein product [Arabidopsis thaliana]
MGWQRKDPSTDFRGDGFISLENLRFFAKTFSFLEYLESECAFGLLYCVAFVVMDKQWLDKNATYMEFNDVLRCIKDINHILHLLRGSIIYLIAKMYKGQLERELMMDDVFRIEDMPLFSLLS